MKHFLTIIFILNVVQLSLAQNLKTIEGRIVNNEGKPVLAMNIYEKGNTINFVKCNKDGYFSIQVKSGTTLIFAGDISYNRQEKAIDCDKFMNVVMLEKNYNDDYEKVDGFYYPKNLMSREIIETTIDPKEYSKGFILNKLFFDCQKKEIGESIRFPIGGFGSGQGYVPQEIDYTKTKFVIIGKSCLLVNKTFDSQVLRNLLHNPESIQNQPQSEFNDSIVTYLQGDRMVLKKIAPQLYAYQSRKLYMDDDEGLFHCGFTGDSIIYISDGLYATNREIYIIQKTKTANLPINLEEMCSVYSIYYSKPQEQEDILEDNSKEYLRLLKYNNSGIKDNIDRNNLQTIRNKSGKSTCYTYDGKSLFYKNILIASDIDINMLKILHPECLTDGTTHYIAGKVIHKDDLFIEMDWIW